MPNVSYSGNSVRLTQVTSDIWVADAAPIHIAGVEVPLRMTVVRLSGGELILHSPVKYSDQLRAELERIGPIKFLLAPNIAHWMFLRDWQTRLPQVVTFGPPGLANRRQVRKAGVRVDTEINGETPPAWSADLLTVSVTAPGFSEIELFDKRSRTLILTDLVQNLNHSTSWDRLAGSLIGVEKPDGKAPIYLRMLLRLGGRATQAAARRLIKLAPERVIFAHGEWFRALGTERLQHSLRWLLPTSQLHLRRQLPGTRVVITGASSGIGRAAALRFAEEGAKVVLAARRKDVIDQLAYECEAIGGQTIAVETDVTDPEAVRQLALRAADAFGGIDVWINNAGTGVFGPYHEADVMLHRKTIEVNLLGTMHGASAVLPIFLRQNHGILINNISLGGWAPAPFAAAYTASKFGLRGFTASLRQELTAFPRIHVCGVFPAMVDTPGFEHGTNVSGKRLDPGPLLYQPDDVADAFVSLAQRPRDETAVGWPARAGQIAYALAPKPTERAVAAVFNWLLSGGRTAANTEGTLMRPGAQGTAVDGGWLVRKKLPPAGVATKVGLLAAAGALTLFMASRARRLPSNRPQGHVVRQVPRRRLRRA
jgi:short-subunit dehydrogenase